MVAASKTATMVVVENSIRETTNGNRRYNKSKF
jgi:hypothetical protein